MADKVKFELVSPEKVLISEDADMVVVPGTEGNFGVLPGHAPLISSIRPGVIDVYNNGSITERLFVESGFAEVALDRLTVLADAAQPVASLDRAAAEAELASALTDAAKRVATAKIEALNSPAH